MKKILRGGWTTGACAAAGVKAALTLLTAGKAVDAVELTALDGTRLTIPIARVEKISDGATVEVIKFSGDDPDITNGASVITTVKIFGDEIIFRAGIGVGHITKAGLQLPIGEPAINPGPRQLIRNVAADFNVRGLVVEISIPAGVELAKRTLNPVLGVEGGLSVIGTTGVLRPMSEDAFKNSLVPQIDVALAAGHRTLIFVPGKIGETIARRLGFEVSAIIQTSNFIGFMLEAAADRNVERVILCGHIGKLVKVAAGIFHTHNRIADARLETLAAYSAAEGLPAADVQKILDANTAEDAAQIINANGLQRVYKQIARRVSLRAERFVFGKIKVATILVDYAGNVLGLDEAAENFIGASPEQFAQPERN
ncbi:MAG: cobalamin biosynthesis protein CbiD [Quinella sp. 2Q5]|nr:cobalamin biosynthesis protein CbiD [Quinella sp. 2Q5]